MASRLTPEEVTLWRGFLSWSEKTIVAVGADLAAKSSLSVSDFEVAIRLKEAGGELLQLALGDALEWSASRVSHQLRRMEQRGLIVRRSAGRGRSVQVSLTDTGRAVLESAIAVHAESVRTHFLAPLRPEVAAMMSSSTGRETSEG